VKLLWVKRGLPGLHPLNQLFDSIKGGLICEPGRQETVMIDLLIDLNKCSHIPWFHILRVDLAATFGPPYKTMKPLFCSFPKGTTPIIKRDHSVNGGWGAIKICMSETGRRLRRNSLPRVLLGVGTTESKGENDVQARSCNIAVICARICPR
jgi:hypothetical protein